MDWVWTQLITALLVDESAQGPVVQLWHHIYLVHRNNHLFKLPLVGFIVLVVEMVTV